METQQTHLQHNTPSNAVLEVLRAMSEFASPTAVTSVAGSQKHVFQQDPKSRFLGFERTPLNALFGKTIIVAFFAQFALFYFVWWLCPSLSKNRRGLAWVLTLGCACWLLLTASSEFGYLRTPLWSYLGWEQALGGQQADANIFSYWLPAFHAWALQLGVNTNNNLIQDMTFESLLLSLSSVESAKVLLSDRMAFEVLAGEYLRWLMSLPFFSLAPLNPPQLVSETAPYFLGGGGRLLLSLENFPRESVWSSLLCGYFVAYCAADLVIGWIHYREHIDPASGYIHHLSYSWLIWQLGRHGQLSLFLICGGLLEVSTIFLASGYIFPRLREDFWFPSTFIFVRILFVGLMLHETGFNIPTAPGAVGVYFLAFLMHVFWINKYFQGLMKRTRKAKEVLEKKEALEKKEQELKLQERSRLDGAAGSALMNGAGENSTTTFQLRAVKKIKNHRL
ncbi:hypothetical protein BGW39_010650 [Mortierella sp. 14UC]|nr:hypothetical protein BGW39_010650 [Mortierella sp. 14UC]